MKTDYKYHNQEYEIEYDIELGEPETYDYCGSPDVLSIYSVHTSSGDDVTDICSENFLDSIEQYIIYEL